MARKPRLFDPRTGHRISIERHRELLRYSERKVRQFDALADDAHERKMRVRSKAARLRWAKKQDRYDDRLKYWQEFRRRLEEELVVRIEYEAKFAYTGKSEDNNRDRANLNIRMRYVGKLPLPTDREVKMAYYNLCLKGAAPKGWEFAVCDWRNDRKSDRGWRRGSWHSGGSQPDTEGRGRNIAERTDASKIDWAADMVVNSTIEDFETLVIGEVEE